MARGFKQKENFRRRKNKDQETLDSPLVQTTF